MNHHLYSSALCIQRNVADLHFCICSTTISTVFHGLALLTSAISCWHITFFRDRFAAVQ